MIPTGVWSWETNNILQNEIVESYMYMHRFCSTSSSRFRKSATGKLTECWQGNIIACYHSDRCNKNVKPEFSRIKGGGSISAISICCIDLEISSTVNGMLHMGEKKSTFLVYSHGNAWNPEFILTYVIVGNHYLESSSNKNELLTALFDSSIIITLILEITCS